MNNCEFYFSNQTTDENEDIELLFNSVLLHCLDFMGLKDKMLALSTTLVNTEQIHKINKEYRNIDRPTDVISFAYDDDKTELNDEIDDLGEIVICLDVARIQAKEFNHKVERELAFLFIHGFLHLLGYDHMKGKKEEEEMFSLQNDILNSFKYDYKEI